jgi:hypothetical protein
MLGLVVGLLLRGVGMAVDVASLTGKSLCLFVPSQSASLAWVVASLTLGVMALGLSFLGLLIPGVQIIAWLVDFAGWIVFVLFLRSLGELLDVSWIARSANGLISLAVFGVGTCVLLLGIMFYFMVSVRPTSGDRSAWGGLLFLCPFILLSLALVSILLICLFRYLHVVRDVSAQVEEEMAMRVQPLSGKTARRLRDY